MKNKLQTSGRQRYRTRTKVILVLTFTSFLLLFVSSLLVVLNLNTLSKMRAAGTNNEGGGMNIGNGEIISEFTWDSGDAKTATLGPDAISNGKTAHITNGGQNSTNGVSPGG